MTPVMDMALEITRPTNPASAGEMTVTTTAERVVIRLPSDS